LTEVLHRFGLDAVKHEFPRGLSEGERRRAKLARALITEPHLLVLDEPTLGLDQTSATALWDLLFREHQRGMTILATISDLPQDPRFDSCQIIKMAKGT
jgi:ABC-2 type transport system ATP-binding protein